MKYNLLMTELNKMFDDMPLKIIKKDTSKVFYTYVKSAKRIFRNSKYEVIHTYKDTDSSRLTMVIRERLSNFDKNMQKISDKTK